MEAATAAVAPLAGLGAGEYLLPASHGSHYTHKFSTFDIQFLPNQEKVTDSRYSHMVFHRLPKPPPAPKADPAQAPKAHPALPWGRGGKHARKSHGGAEAPAAEPLREVVIYHRAYR